MTFRRRIRRCHVRTTYSKGTWVAQVLVDPRGSVSDVRLVRRIVFTPPVPGFDDAIIDAISQWRFEPPLVKGEPASFCMGVASIVHFE